ncbi:MAG: 2-oxo acid dehydrogenase subunit E2 [Candidatus Dormibacteraeota bacterium]|nr:2-oxo acid dehydrogenase subunit E2 [Candidatus Dormibacteraeota bacterium]
MGEIRDFLMPDLGEGLTEGEISRWLVAVGDRVSVDQPIAEVTTEKALVEVPTPFGGSVAALHGSPGDLIKVGTPLISIAIDSPSPTNDRSGNVLVGYGTNEERSSRRARTASGARTAPPAVAQTAAMPSPAASPVVRRLAAERGIDLSTITGTGPGGLISQADLERVSSRAAIADNGSAVVAADGTRQRLTGVDRVAAERLGRSSREIPTATATLTVEATELLEVRSRYREGGSQVTPFALLLRLCVIALRRYPRLNAHFDGATNEVVTFDACHLGVAVQTERGLVVPVIRDADRLRALPLAARLEELATSARNATISQPDLQGSTFTVSNFGAFGVDGGTAIINPPEVAILGVGRIAERPWIVGGGMAPRSVVELSLVFDHRVADGAVGGGFLRHFGDLIEHAAEALKDD